ncbi:MAG: septum formation initiator family protein [Actinomycetota bacterium]|nr:septum formation initiator family protein [Actinomycetota bacterium]
MKTQQRLSARPARVAQRASASSRRPRAPVATKGPGSPSRKPRAPVAARGPGSPSRRPRAPVATRGPGTTRGASTGKHRNTRSPTPTRTKPAKTEEAARARSGLGFATVFTVAAVGIAVLLLVTDFPIGNLISQHRQLATANAQLSSVSIENAGLRQQITSLNSSGAIETLAHRYFNLVKPGQRSFLVIPPKGQSQLEEPLPKRLPTPATPSLDLGKGGASSSSATTPSGVTSIAGAATTSANTGASGAPATSGPGTANSATHQAASTNAAHGRVPSGYWSRVLHDLEFWRS